MASHDSGAVDGAAAALRGYWPPFAALAGRVRDQVTIVRGEGAVVWDDGGREYLDGTAGLWYANVGHGRREIADAVRDQLTRLAAYSNFGTFATEPTLVLTERIARLAPLDDPLVFLTSGGSDAVDSAVKIVRRYWTLRGRPDKQTFISRECSYHGMHGHGTALAGIDANSAGYGGPAPTDFLRAPANDAEALREQIERIGPERVAAVFVEPVIGAGGVVPPAPGYLAAVRELCDRFELLFVADEVVCGFGRLGSWFGCERYDIRPDLLLFAKGVTSGYAPLGGVIAARSVWEVFHAEPTPFRHGYTYSGHAAACAAAIANLDILESEQLLERVRKLEPVLAEAMGSLTDHDLVADVRSAGLLAAVQLVPGSTQPETEQVVSAARRHGALTRVLPGAALHVSPSFVISEDQLWSLADRFRAALDDVARAG